MRRRRRRKFDIVVPDEREDAPAPADRPDGEVGPPAAPLEVSAAEVPPADGTITWVEPAFRVLHHAGGVVASTVPHDPAPVEPVASLPVSPAPVAPAPVAPAPVAPAAVAPPVTPVPVDALEAPSPDSPPTRIGEMLLARGLVTSEQLDRALAEQSASGMRLGTQLVDLGMVSERQLIEVLAEQLVLPVADLRQTTPERDAVESLPEALAREFEVVPLRIRDGALELAMADVLNGGRDKLEEAAGRPITPVLAPPSEIRQALDRAYVVFDDVEEQVQAFVDLASSRVRPEQTHIVVDDNAPVVQVVTLLLTQAMRDRASDIHIEPQPDKLRVRYRVDGVLRDVMEIPESMAQSLVSRIKVMANMNIVERRRPQDGQIATVIDDRPLDIRVATTSTIFGEKAVLRLLDTSQALRALSELGMSEATSRQFSSLITSPFGMVICAGPTGSGKTTTLYAAINEIQSSTRNITTIEDPVEYVMPSINQIQVNEQAGVTFANGLKSILRQDPDIILVGEVRDVETARIAVQSALTGHLVLSSLHATDAATALQRFRDMGIEPFLITSAVLAVISQRLVRRICDDCRERYEPTPAERTYFERAIGHEKPVFWHGAGCNLCSHTGYKERVGVYELLRVTEPMKHLVVQDAGYEELRALAVSEGMTTLRDESLRLVDEDVTTLAEAARTIFVG